MEINGDDDVVMTVGVWLIPMICPVGVTNGVKDVVVIGTNGFAIGNNDNCWEIGWVIRRIGVEIGESDVVRNGL